ncbi:MAG: DUF1579 domain-containing protein [Vitreimonas sp.]
MSSEHDFDFLVGEWRVAHRRLKERLANCSEWLEFGGHCSLRQTLGGFANVDDNVLDMPGGAYRAMTVRTFDPAAKQWSIWWFDGRNPGALDPPMVGAFEDNVGLFFCEDAFQGRPIRVRFIWTVGDEPRWEQAFSADGGATWETNWTMDFTRA